MKKPITKMFGARIPVELMAGFEAYKADLYVQEGRKVSTQELLIEMLKERLGKHAKKLGL